MPRPIRPALSLLLLVTFLLVHPLAAVGASWTAPGGTFVDDDGSTHEGYIESLVEAEVTTGCDAVGPRYCPGDPITRAQMATFLARALHLDLSAPDDRFDDDNGSVHEAAIDAIAAAGVTLGCADGVRSFCPNDPVSRGQMAAFLVRAFDLPAATTNDRFVDDDGSVFEQDIDALAEAGVTLGCAEGTGRFCPGDPVRRDQMATFLGRVLGLAPLVPPPRPGPEARMGADHAVIVGFGERVAGTEAEAAALDWLEQQLTDIVGEAEREDVPLVNGRTSANVWASVGAGAEVILLGAHVDSVAGTVGADDNASGVAVLLDVFRHAVAHPPEGTTIVAVFFGAEERLSGYSADVHHAGSRAMAARLAATGELPDRMFSIDMVGVGADLLAVTYQTTSTLAAAELTSAAAAAGVPIATSARGDISDHEAFALHGVPSAFLWRPDNPAWHTPGDTSIEIGLLMEDRAVLVELLDRYGR